MKANEIIKNIYEITDKQKNDFTDIQDIACSYFFVEHTFYTREDWQKYKELIRQLLAEDEAFLALFNAIQEKYGVVGVNDVYDPMKHLDY